MRHILPVGLTVLILGVVGAFSADPPKNYAGPREKLHIYILVGQSNMSGRAPVEEVDRKPLDGVYLLNAKNEWEPADHPLNRYTNVPNSRDKTGNGLNIGWTFARKMREADPNTSIGLIVNAQGGSAVQAWFKGKGTTNYDRALERVKPARDKGVIKGILWHQGEANVKTPDTYLKSLGQVIAAFRDDLGDPNLPFVAGQLAQTSDACKVFNENLLKLPDVVPRTAVVSSDGTSKADVHFDAKSTRLLGERYAEQMLKLRKADK